MYNKQIVHIPLAFSVAKCCEVLKKMHWELLNRILQVFVSCSLCICCMEMPWRQEVHMHGFRSQKLLNVCIFPKKIFMFYENNYYRHILKHWQNSVVYLVEDQDLWTGRRKSCQQTVIEWSVCFDIYWTFPKKLVAEHHQERFYSG